MHVLIFHTPYVPAAHSCRFSKPGLVDISSCVVRFLHLNVQYAHQEQSIPD